MDSQFPQQLFPSLYRSGPPDVAPQGFAGKWGSYEQVRPQGGSGPFSSWTFTSKHHTRGESWHAVEPVPLPFLSPKKGFQGPLTPPDPLDFTDHLNNYYLDQSQEAFGVMTDLLSENFIFDPKLKKEGGPAVNMWKVKKFLNRLNPQTAPPTYSSNTLDSYCQLLADVVPSVSPPLLGSLLYQELAEQRDRLLFCEETTGGALAFLPLSQGSSSQQGVLVYPGSQGLELNFQKVELQQRHEGCSLLEQSSRKPFSFHIKGVARQLSHACLFSDCCVGVRSDYFCGVWRFSDSSEPRLLQVVNTRDVCCCISISPHILGEVLVASESGSADLWRVGRGMQRVRAENTNLYFNAKSSWRWCEFTAHPRVMLYADRTGAELADIRVDPSSNRTLFNISSSTSSRRGERLVLCKYLENVHSFHHLITTQYSAYVMDERFPRVPMLQLDHLMEAPPLLCHSVPSAEIGGVLLGAHRSQEITLVQYTGGQAQTCSSLGPPQALLRPKEGLHHLPVQIPHRLDTLTRRLSSPATGLTSIQTPSGEKGRGCVCVLQLTEAGDIFYQILEGQPSQPPSTETPSRTLEETPSGGGVVRRTPPEEAPSSPVDSSEESEFLRDVSDDDVVEEGAAGGPPAPPEPCPPGRVSSRALLVWKRWLQKLFHSSCKNKPLPQLPRPFPVSTGGLLTPPQVGSRPPSEEVETLRRTLRTCMSKRSLLQTSLLPQTPAVPVPDPADPQVGTDPLSQRLARARQGEEAWLAWWEEQLGVNREAKVRALRRRRRREKVRRRRCGLQSELSSSFSSSASGLSDTNQLSGWSSAPSDAEEWTEVDSPCLTPVSTTQRVTAKSLATPTTCPLPLDQRAQSSPAPHRSITPLPQEEPSQTPRPPQTSYSQTSVGRRPLSQSSQSMKKKKSRMGF